MAKFFAIFCLEVRGGGGSGAASLVDAAERLLDGFAYGTP